MAGGGDVDAAKNVVDTVEETGAGASKACIIRPANDMNEAKNLWWPLMQELGWNRAEQDMATHYPSATHQLGGAGWPVVAAKDYPEKAEGCIVPFVFDNKTAWVGFFILNERMRGNGWGGELFAAALKTFKDNGVEYAGLDAVEAQVKTYERRGFQVKGKVRLMVRKDIDEVPLTGGFEHVPTDRERLVPLREVPSKVLTESDLSITGMKRSTLWSKEALFDARDDVSGLALVAHSAREHKDKLDGWILIRSCQDGWRFGPLYAKDKKDAAFLLHQALYRLQGPEYKGTYIAEVWEGNKEAVKMFEEAGWEWCGVDYHRMWLDGKVPKEQQDGGVSSREMWATFDAGQG